MPGFAPSVASARSRGALPQQPEPADLRRIVPTGHPLELWEIDEAAARCKVSNETLRVSRCPRMKVGSRVLFDPIETIAWFRTHLTHTVAESQAADGATR